MEIESRPEETLAIRPLGLLERYTVARMEIDAYRNFNIAFRLRYKGEMNEDDVHDRWSAALRDVAVAHPTLSTGIYGSGSQQPVFVPLDPRWHIPLVVLRTEGSLPSLESLQLHAVDARIDPLDKTQPLWRMFVQVLPTNANGQTLINAAVAFHHSIADGRSGMLFLESFLDRLDGQEVIKNPFPKAMENVINLTPGFYFLLKNVVIELLTPKWLRPWFVDSFYDGEVELNQKQSSSPVKPGERHTDLVFAVLPPSQTSQLASQARKHGTTVHAALLAATSAAVYKHHIEATSSNSPLNIVTTTPVNLRPRGLRLIDQPVSNSTIGTYVCAAKTNHRISQSTFFWALARDAKQQITNNTESGIEEVGLLSFVSGPWETFFTDKFKSRRNGHGDTFEVSNLGSFDFEERGGYSVERVSFSQSKNYVGSWICLNVVTVNGVMEITLSYRPQLLAQEKARQILTDTISAIEKAIMTDDDFRIGNASFFGSDYY